MRRLKCLLSPGECSGVRNEGSWWLQEAALVAPTDAMQRMQELLRSAEAALLALSKAVSERDEAIREKDATIARLSGQLAELRASQDQ
jgi:hypothetical protein